MLFLIPEIYIFAVSKAWEGRSCRKATNLSRTWSSLAKRVFRKSLLLSACRAFSLGKTPGRSWQRSFSPGTSKPWMWIWGGKESQGVMLESPSHTHRDKSALAALEMLNLIHPSSNPPIV